MYIEGRVRVYESMRCTTINYVLVSHAQSLVSFGLNALYNPVSAV